LLGKVIRFQSRHSVRCAGSREDFPFEMRDICIEESAMAVERK
jgi:hypothetical protein